MRLEWKTLTRLASVATSWHMPISSSSFCRFCDATDNHSLLNFEIQTKKSSQWFWSTNHQTVTVVLRLKPKNPQPQVLRPNREKPSYWFWGQTTDKPSTLVVRLNQETRASHLLVYGVACAQHHPTSQSFGHWVPNMCNHPWSSAPGLLLLTWSLSLPAMPHLSPAHHETSNRDSPHEQRLR
jgi:hypothetical protein